MKRYIVWLTPKKKGRTIGAENEEEAERKAIEEYILEFEDIEIREIK